MQLRIEKKPDGPLITINEDGTVTVARAPPDEAGKVFWDAVNIAGSTYAQKVAALTELVETLKLQVAALSLDPFRSIVQGSPYAIRAEMHKVDKETISATDISAVLDTINAMACKAIQ